MSPLNNMLNRINTWNTPEEGFIKKEIGARLANFFFTLPLEITAIAENILATGVYTASTALKSSMKVVTFLSGSEAIDKFEKKLPGFLDLLKSIARVVAYTFIGLPSTILFGVIISPEANYQLHCKQGLAAVQDVKKHIITPIESPSTEDLQHEIQPNLAGKEQGEKNTLEEKIADAANELEKDAKLKETLASNIDDGIESFADAIEKEMVNDLLNQKIAFETHADFANLESKINAVEEDVKDVATGIIKEFENSADVETDPSLTTQNTSVEKQEVKQEINEPKTAEASPQNVEKDVQEVSLKREELETRGEVKDTLKIIEEKSLEELDSEHSKAIYLKNPILDELEDSMEESSVDDNSSENTNGNLWNYFFPKTAN